MTRKILSLILVALLLLPAVADAIHPDPILFQGIPWGSDFYATDEALRTLWGIPGLGSYGGSEIAVLPWVTDDGTEIRYQRKLLTTWCPFDDIPPIGGNPVYRLLLHAPHETGELCAAVVYFGVKDGEERRASREDVYNNLRPKLIQLYGEPEKQNETWAVWRGAEDTQLHLILSDNYVSLTYAGQDMQELIQTLTAALPVIEIDPESSDGL